VSVCALYCVCTFLCVHLTAAHVCGPGCCVYCVYMVADRVADWLGNSLVLSVGLC
jgi:hypothetical protein